MAGQVGRERHSNAHNAKALESYALALEPYDLAVQERRPTG